jgi:hypothetical protein
MFFERPTSEQIEEAIAEHFARLVVVDTISEFVDGLVENANLPEQWTPILRRFRQIASGPAPASSFCTTPTAQPASTAAPASSALAWT